MNRLWFCLGLLFFSPLVMAQDNPFYSTPRREPPEVTRTTPGFLGGVFQQLSTWQQALHGRLSRLARQLKTENRGGLLLAGLAFLYGLIHALGPGHGKIIMSSYALARPLKARQGILLGVMIALIHSFSAILLVSLLYFWLDSTYAGFSREPKRIVSLVSFGLIAGMGLFLLVKNILETLPGRRAHPPVVKDRMRNLVIPALLIGLVPCEGAVLILVFAMSIDAFLLGITLTLAMSLGMAVTISLIGLMIIYSRQGALAVIPKAKKWPGRIGKAFELVGALLVLFFGLLMFFFYW